MFYTDLEAMRDYLGTLELPNGIKSDDVMAWWMGCQYVVNLLDDAGLEWKGYSYRPRVPLGLLVVKATLEMAPVVCFVSARTLTTAFRIFFRELREDRVQWVPDKYA